VSSVLVLANLVNMASAAGTAQGMTK
jgi:hypothetical protein